MLLPGDRRIRRKIIRLSSSMRYHIAVIEKKNRMIIDHTVITPTEAAAPTEMCACCILYVVSSLHKLISHQGLFKQASECCSPLTIAFLQLLQGFWHPLLYLLYPIAML